MLILSVTSATSLEGTEDLADAVEKKQRGKKWHKVQALC